MDLHQIQGYEVLENGKPTIDKNSDVWNRYFYANFDNALNYVKDYLGIYAITLPENWQGEPYDYSRFGDFIEIRFVPGIEV